MPSHVPERSKGVGQALARNSAATRAFALPVQRIIHNQIAGGAALLIATAAALLWANSPLRESYEAFRTLPIGFNIGGANLSNDLQHWVNDALMVLFFFAVGLEIKREVVHGELSSWKHAALPSAAALGGMLVPAAIYAALNWGEPTITGWGIPIATDIAFALGVLALLGKSIPSQLRIFLLALATVDDIGAILIIAVFYTHDMSWAALGAAVLIFVIILAMQMMQVRNTLVYIVVAFFFWLAVYLSGVHATIAGVILGLITPASAAVGIDRFVAGVQNLSNTISKSAKEDDYRALEHAVGELEINTKLSEPPLDRLQRNMHVWVTFVVLPVFALVNAGVTIDSGALETLRTSHIAWGIAGGLLVGKLLGTGIFSLIAVKTGLGKLPENVTMKHIFATSMLAGIGFTVSLFITGLSFTEHEHLEAAKIGVLSASAVAAIVGYFVLRLVSRKPKNEKGSEVD